MDTLLHSFSLLNLKRRRRYGSDSIKVFQLISEHRNGNPKADKTDEIKELLGKVDINYKDGDGDTFLSAAIQEGHSDIVKLLLSTPKIEVNINHAIDLALRSTHADKQDIILQLTSRVEPTKNRVVLFKGMYTEDQLRTNPNILFLFGDNDEARYRIDNSNPGGSGQASVTRPLGFKKAPFDRPPNYGGINGNAIGITTSFGDGNTPNLNEFTSLIDREFTLIKTWVENGGFVVIPCEGNRESSLGGNLKTTIPGASDYLQSKVDELVKLGENEVTRKYDYYILIDNLHNTLVDERRSYNSLKISGAPGSSGQNARKRTQVVPSAIVDVKKRKNEFYESSGLKNSLHGVVYQLKLLMLFMKRGTDAGYEFRLATEQDAAEKFDDLVFEYTEHNQKKYIFLQAKHKQDEDNLKIGFGDLLTLQEGGEFNLKKYFLSYLKIKNNINFENAHLQELIICANIDFDLDKQKEKLEGNPRSKNSGKEIYVEAISGVDVFFKDGGKRFKLPYGNNKNLIVDETFKKAVTEGVKQFQKNIDNLKHKIQEEEHKGNTDAASLNAINKLKHKLQQNEIWYKEFDGIANQGTKLEINIKEFFDKLIFAVDQPNEVKLSNIIKAEIGKEYDLTDRENVYSRFQDYALDWMKEKEGRYLSHQDVNEFFDGVRKGISIWFNIDQVIDTFTGRNEELKRIHEALHNEGKKVIITGLGGVGKSELAIKYINEHVYEYDNKIVRINAENFQTLKDSFCRLATDKLGIRTKDSNGEEKNFNSIVEDVYRFFESGKSLFIFDNAHGPNIPLPSMPKRPYLLITSRYQKWENAAVIKLGVFTEREAADFITKVLGTGQHEIEISNLAKRLGNFPLALQQAVAYIKEKKSSFSEFGIKKYLKIFEKETQDLLKYFPTEQRNSHAKTTFTTWKITIDHMRKNEDDVGKKAVKILEVMSYFESGSIPVEIFFDSIDSHARQNIEASVELLKKFSMASEGSERFFVDVHRLVQEVIRLKLKKREKVVLKEALNIITNSAVFSENMENHFVSIWRYAYTYGELIDEFFFKPVLLREKSTPLHLLVKYGANQEIYGIFKHIETMSPADNSAAIINAVHAMDSVGNTPLHVAARNDNFEMFTMLSDKNGVDVNVKNEFGDTPLHTAASSGNIEIVKYLIDVKRVDRNAKNRIADTPLHAAANGFAADENHSLETVKYLIDNGVEPNVRNKFGDTPLHSAAYSGNVKVVDYLIDEKLVRLNVRNEIGDTPLSAAIQGGNLKMVKHLIEKGAAPNVNNEFGHNSIYNAIVGGHSDIFTYFIDNIQEINLNVKTINGETLLHTAALGNDLNVLKKVINNLKNVDLNVRDINDRTPLHYAASNNYLETVDYLEGAGADIDSADKFGQTPKDLLSLSVPGKECLSSSSYRTKRNAENKCLFTWEDVDKFNEETIEKRQLSKIKIDSEKFSEYIENLPQMKRNQLIQLADNAEIIGKSQHFVRSLINNQRLMKHLSIVGSLSGRAMHLMMAKNIFADFYNGNYVGVAVNVGFLAGGQGLGKLAEVASIKGLKLASGGKFLFGRFLGAASPFLARGTSVFVIYDLVNQIKEYKNGNKDALVGIVADGIVLGIDAAEIGIGIAESLAIIEGVSAVTGPIGLAVGALVFVGADVYMSVRKVSHVDEIIHLNTGEKFVEGLRAFIGLQPEQYLAELVEEKLHNNELVTEGLKYLQLHSDIKRFVFPVDAKDLDNEALLHRSRNDIKWSRAKPDEPIGGVIFCHPQGDYELVPSSGSYVCKGAVGLTDLSTKKTGNYTLISLGEGKDSAKGFPYSPNIFVVNNGRKEYEGGNRDDTFFLQGDLINGHLYGGDGLDTLDLTGFAQNCTVVHVDLSTGNIVTSSYKYSNNYNVLRVIGMQSVLGRLEKSERIICTCDTRFLDGKGSTKDHDDVIVISDNNCTYSMQIIVRPYTVIYNRAWQGDFHYTVPYAVGSAAVYASGGLNVTNTFTFQYGSDEINNIDVKTFNNHSHEIRINFSRHNFEIIISGAVNPVYRLGNNTEIKVGNKDNLYMFLSSNESVHEIIENYLVFAKRLTNMLFSIQSIPNNETVLIGSGQHEVIHNNPLCRSHLVGNGGENIYIIDFGDELFEVDKLPMPEVVIYDRDAEKSVDTIDFRNLVQQATKFSYSFKLQILQYANDIVFKATVTEVEPTGDSPVTKHEFVTVTLNNGVNLYGKTHVMVGNVLKEIVLVNNEWSLKPLPLVFGNATEVIVLTSQDVDESTELLLRKRAGNFIFFHNRYTDLLITNVCDKSISKNDLFTIIFSRFYETRKMQKLSIRFSDRVILLENEKQKINFAKDFKENRHCMHHAASQKYQNIRVNYNENNAGNTALHWAVLNDSLAVVKSLTKGADINVKNSYGKTPLDLAEQNDRIEVIKFFITKMSSNIMPPLHWSIQNCSLRVIELFINTDSINDKDKFGLTPLYYAVRSNRLDVIEKLIGNGANINAENDKGEKLVHFAAAYNRRELIEFLLNKGQNVDETDANGYTPLHRAAAKGALEAAAFLVSKGANIGAEIRSGGKPIHLAAEYDHRDVIEFLLNKGQNVDEINKNGLTPMHYAAKYGHIGIAEVLVNRGANINVEDDNFKLPIHLAATYNQRELIEFLLNKGQNVDETDANGYTPLHLAVAKGALEAALILVSKGANVSAASTNGTQPVHFAAMFNHMLVMRLLLNVGASVNARDINLMRPLHIAAFYGHLELVKFLVKRGANIRVKDMSKNSAIDYAISNRHKKIVVYLKNTKNR